jgi:hypothetical protein
VTISLDRLRREGEAFMEEISREYYLAYSGQKSSPDLQPVYTKHAGILGDESFALTRETFLSAAEGTDERRSARFLLDWQADSQSSRQLAAQDEREIAWESTAVVHVGETRQLQYQAVAIELANERNKKTRHAIDAAREKLVAAELAPLRLERFQRERDIVEGLGDYVETFELLSGISLVDLAAACQGFLRDTDGMWRDVLPEFSRRVLGMEPSELTRADAAALLRARSFDASFPAARMEESIRRQVKEMSVDPLAGGRVVLDTGEREGKRSRAFCSAVRVPNEVYLVMRPHGGQTDWMTFLHELGHALHFAYMQPDLRFEYRWLGDNSITEGYAMLFDHRMQDAGWLARYTELSASNLPSFIRAAGFEELHFLRRYCAKLVYELELYGGATSWSSLPDVYVDRLSSATTMRYSRADAFVDVDPRFYSARYLRAWQLQALLNETLVERYDVDWWRNPRAGPWICSALFGEGQRELAHEQADRVAGRELSFGPLLRSVERMLS